MDCSLPVVEPDNAHTHLKINSEGLAAIARIQNPVAIVAVSALVKRGTLCPM